MADEPGRDTARWAGEWVTERLGVRVVERGTGDGVGVRSLAGLAVRRNPRRAHLMVSPVLGKHVPVAPRLAREAGEALGRQVAAALAQDGSAPSGTPVVLGFAETATGLGHCVADALAAPYLHSTRRTLPGRSGVLGFEEQHSHASSHHLLPDDPGMLDTGGPVVLVDDELTTGTTAANTIRALEGRSHHPTYVVAALLDLRPADALAELDRCAAELGVRIVAVATGRGEVELPDDVLERGQELVAALPEVGESAGAVGRVRRLELTAGAGLRQGGRHGFGAADRAALDAVVPSWASTVVEALADGPTAEPGDSLHVLGTEELMYLPLRLAEALAEAVPAARVTFSSTTRSPIAVVDDPGYAVRSAVGFAAHDDTDDAPRFAYNLGTTGERGRFDHLVVVLDRAADTAAATAPGGLIDALAGVADDVLVVVLPEDGGA